MHASRWDTSILRDSYLLCIEIGWKRRRNRRKRFNTENAEVGAPFGFAQGRHRPQKKSNPQGSARPAQKVNRRGPRLIFWSRRRLWLPLGLGQPADKIG